MLRPQVAGLFRGVLRRHTCRMWNCASECAPATPFNYQHLAEVACVVRLREVCELKNVAVFYRTLSRFAYKAAFQAERSSDHVLSWPTGVGALLPRPREVQYTVCTVNATVQRSAAGAGRVQLNSTQLKSQLCASPARPLGRRPASPPHSMPPVPRHLVGRVDAWSLDQTP